MYRHILIPTDGSELANRAVEAGIAFARSIGARITGFTAVPEYRAPSHAELMAGTAISLEEHERRVRRRAECLLEPVARRALAAGVPCETAFAPGDRPCEAIVRAAEAHGCDLIFLASQAGQGLGARFHALVHGSQTRGVLAASRIPTLVFR